MRPVSEDTMRSLDSPEAIAEEVHNALSEEEGLVEVNCGTTIQGKKYAYSLIKILHEPRRTEYKLTMHIGTPDSVTEVTGYFMENGSPGYREAVIKSRIARENQGIRENEVFSGWSGDPYDPSYTKGYLMNESEKSIYDERFPLHPLTEARKFAASLIAEN